MTTSVAIIPEASTSVLSFSQLNVILRHYERLAIRSVSTIANTPPVSPADGLAVLVGTSPTGVFVGQANRTAFSIGGTWYFVRHSQNLQRIFVEDEGRFYRAGGSNNWVGERKDDWQGNTFNSSLTYEFYRYNQFAASVSGLTITLDLNYFGDYFVETTGSNAIDYVLGAATITATPGGANSYLHFVFLNGVVRIMNA